MASQERERAHLIHFIQASGGGDSFCVCTATHGHSGHPRRTRRAGPGAAAASCRGRDPAATQGAGTADARPARPVPAAVDEALQAVLPRVFKAQPASQGLAPLREGLAALHDALMVAGDSGDLKPLVAALTDSVSLHDFIAAHAQGPLAGSVPRSGREGVELDDLAAVGARGTRMGTHMGTHEEAIGVLEALVNTACQALGAGRDGGRARGLVWPQPCAGPRRECLAHRGCGAPHAGQRGAPPGPGRCRGLACVPARERAEGRPGTHCERVQDRADQAADRAHAGCGRGLRAGHGRPSLHANWPAACATTTPRAGRAPAC